MTKGVWQGIQKATWRIAERSARFAGAEPIWAIPGHFYSPIADRRESLEHLERIERLIDEPTLPGVVIDRDHLRTIWHELIPSLKDSTLAMRPTAGKRYNAERKRLFPRCDALMLHAFMRTYGPRRIIEVGSGHSSACMLDTADAHLPECRFTFIDPYPQRLFRMLPPGDAHHEVLAQRVQEVPIERFLELKANDILFIDSSHVAKTGSDVCFLFFEILPRMAEGVLVHVHDIHWPFEYPRDWVLKQNRSWNETQFLRAYLTGNRDWRVEMFSEWFKRFEKDLIADTFSTFLEKGSGSIWLRRVAPG